jgi:carboxymethylenebutenolidase
MVTIQSRWIDLAAEDGGTFHGFLALPPAGKGPGIVLLQEIFGVNSHIRGVAEQYAQDGYVVLAPDLFWRAEPRTELGYGEADRGKAMALYHGTDIDRAVADVAAAANALRALPEVTGKVAVVGYCLGGRLAYLAAARSAVDIAVSYYGGGIDQALDQADAVKVPIQFHFGERDAHIPAESVEKIRARFAGRADAQVHIYAGADHGFNCWDRASYHPHAAGLAHGRALTFLGEHA